MGGNSNNKKSSPSEFSEEAVRRVMVEALKDPGMLQVLTQAIRTAIVEDLKQTIAENSAVIESLKTALEEKDRHIRQLQMKVDDLEQYQRRQCLRIFGVSESESENTDTIAIDVASKIGVQLTESDIDRSHRVGRRNSDRPRPIIVKFVSYRKRAEVFRNKKLLKGSLVTVREDLTKARHNLLKECITKYSLKNVWTQDGDIIVKVGEHKHRIKCPEDMI